MTLIKMDISGRYLLSLFEQSGSSKKVCNHPKKQQQFNTNSFDCKDRSAIIAGYYTKITD